MSRKADRPEDDGHVIADMSGIERQNLFLPRFKPRRPIAYEQPPQEDRPWEPEFQLTPEERRMQIWIALKAALLIALVFIVGLGAVILLLLWLWT